MRAKEFVINVPINIKINSDGAPNGSTPTDKTPSSALTTSLLQQTNVPKTLPKNKKPVMVPPLQQAIELQKAALGKRSSVISSLTSNESIRNRKGTNT